MLEQRTAHLLLTANYVGYAKRYEERVNSDHKAGLTTEKHENACHQKGKSMFPGKRMAISGYKCLKEVAVAMDYERAIIFAVKYFRKDDPTFFNEDCGSLLRKDHKI